MSASAILEILTVREKIANKELKERLEGALIRADRAETRVRKLEDVIQDLRIALGEL